VWKPEGEALGRPLSGSQPLAAAGRASGSMDTDDNRHAAASTSSGPSEPQTVLDRSEPVVRLDTRSGLSRTPSSSPLVFFPEGGVDVVQDFSGSVRPPSAATLVPSSPPRLILEIPPPYVSYSSTVPPVATAVPTDQPWGDGLILNAPFPWGDGTSIDIPNDFS